LVAVNDGTLPFPPAPRPIAVLLLVQEKVVPGVELVSAVAGTVAPLQTTISGGTVTIGEGLTVIVKTAGALVQLPPVEVTVIVAIIGVGPVLVAVKAG
jgi:hypothetical protein